MPRRNPYKQLIEQTKKYKTQKVSKSISRPTKVPISNLNNSSPEKSPQAFEIEHDHLDSPEIEHDHHDSPSLSVQDNEPQISSGLSNCSFSSDCDDNLLNFPAPQAVPNNVTPQDPIPEFKEELAGWAVNSNIPQSNLNKLLTILRKHTCFTDLPKDSRSLLQTPRKSIVTSVLPGHYFHFGIQQSLSNIFQNSPSLKRGIQNTDKTKLCLQINIDGLPLTKSSGSQFWPILGSVENFMNTPFIIGVYHGLKKPECSNEFLTEFVNEVVTLKERGLDVLEKHFDFEVTVFICDAPAKAFIKKVKGHTGYYGCDRCTQKGRYVEGRTTFPEDGAELRTNISFVLRQQKKHHLGNPILEKIPGIDMVAHFLHDYMHLVCLGAMKKLLLLWIRGNLRSRMSRHQIDHVSEKIINIKSSIPTEFQRNPRGLQDIDRWKATEFRQFLMYTGPLVLKSILEKKYYSHFLALSCAIRILVDPKLVSSYTSTARKLLNFFVSNYARLYGPEMVSYNVHSLIHIAADDAEKYGSLDTFSAFKFENYLQKVKKMVRNSALPLQQLIRRVSEERSTDCDENNDVNHYPVLKESKEVILPKLSIKFKSSDNCVQLSTGEIIIVEDAVKSNLNNKILITGKQFLKSSPYFEKPFNSGDVGIFIVQHLSESRLWPIEAVARKCLIIKLNDLSYYVVTLLHS